MEICLFACVAILSFAQSSGSLLVQKGKLGDTIELALGAKVLDVQASFPQNDSEVMDFQATALKSDSDRQFILKDGEITDYGRKRYGDRLSFENGTLIIRNLTVNDAVTYFYSLQGDKQKPAAIDIVIE
ncbi:unnamed protein product [Onchocerca ochengi]|uniref:Por secretion system C-terminal sorting domain-containing protein n=1 Tax=Onchocerca ochengi TaxID=42157 RepID=A0A182ERX8_ONCOC|nr:unnamed protein product [Onchocerca ochengi]VDM94623.1 unnamed protein product [Onchocerca ochengi]